MKKTNPLDECIRDSLEGYFRDLDGTEPAHLYDMLVKLWHDL